MHISALVLCVDITVHIWLPNTLTFENQHISSVLTLFTEAQSTQPRAQRMSPGQLLQTTIAVGSTSSLMFCRFYSQVWQILSLVVSYWWKMSTEYLWKDLGYASLEKGCLGSTSHSDITSAV